MAAGRSFKSLVSRRRRGDEEGEDDEGPFMMEDSQSEGEDASVLSDAEDDEADRSSLAVSSAAEGGAADSLQDEAKAATHVVGKKAKARKRPAKRDKDKDSKEQASSQPQAAFKAAADTEAMLNGLNIADQVVPEETITFEDMGRNVVGLSSVESQSHTPVIASSDRRADLPSNWSRREHEQYRRKRDADPSFIPNRGNFFMHDNTRSKYGQASPMIRNVWHGRGRGRGGGNAGALPVPMNQAVQANKPAEPMWKHDLHDTINEEPGANRPLDPPPDQTEPARLFPKAAVSNTSMHNGPHAKLSFSSTTLVGKVQIRVLLPGMKAPITFSEVPWKQYTRLPDHRPPLRRDKPVRISLPEHIQRYIFPSTERSFIFIPRQMRPNQQGLGGNRYHRSVGGVGYSSRRTSMYGGSMYAGSIAPSRRSSFASVARDNTFSPVGSFVGVAPTRPVVKLPHAAQSHFSATGTPIGPLSGHQTPTGMQMHTFPLPAQPQYQGTPTTTVHQPRPQKAISVTGIESPAVLQQARDQQPFANQLPGHLTETPQLPPPYFSPRQQYSYAPVQTGTPLSGIPEQATHALSFQPPMMPYGPGPYYGHYAAHQQGYYNPPPAPSGYPGARMYMPPQQSYMMSPPSVPPLPPQHPASQVQGLHVPGDEHQQNQSSQSQSGMVAHESNGMVFYMPASEAPQESQDNDYQPAESFVPSYAMPGLPPPTPAPEQSYYYPSQLPMPGYFPSQ